MRMRDCIVRQAPRNISGYPTRVTIIDRSDEAELEDGDMLKARIERSRLS